jgi:hypothetical protein
MADSFTLIGGSAVNCTDGPCGTLGRLIIDPATMSVTHLAVEPTGLLGAGRLVPTHFIHQGGLEVDLACSHAEFNALDVDETSQVAPTFGARASAMAFSYMTLHRIPEGEVEVNGDENVVASDGRFGHLRGMEVNSGDHRVTELLLTIGHFSAKRTVAVPGALITGIDNEAIKLSASKSQLADLPES